MSQYNKQWPGGRNQFDITEEDMREHSTMRQLLDFKTRLGKLVVDKKITAEAERSIIEHVEASISDDAPDLLNYIKMTDDELIRK